MLFVYNLSIYKNLTFSKAYVIVNLNWLACSFIEGDDVMTNQEKYNLKKGQSIPLIFDRAAKIAFLEE